jgi:L-alanine-DL-glutamate epimerase-like enolase superfamily enzyme
MKVTAIRATPLTVPFAQPFHWHSGAQLGVNLVLFEVETDEGVTGYGEAIGEDPGAVAAYGEAITEFFLGRSPGEVERALDELWTRGRWRTTRHFVSQVAAGIEMACWDAWGKALGVAASTFLGGRVRDEVDFFGFVQGHEPDELAAHARELAEAGHAVIYLKVGRPEPGEDLDCVAAVRDAIGPDRPLRVDANEAWDVPTAIATIRRMEEHDLDFVEQPVSADDVPALAAVRRAVGTAIAADQAVYTPGELRRVLELEAADVVVLGVHEAGGMWRLRQMAFMCQSHGIPLNRHGCLESSISTAAALQVIAAVPNQTEGHQLMHHLLAERLTLEPELKLVDGRIRVPDAPGLGIRIDEEAVARAADRYRSEGRYHW